jgi:hypothetical protein
MGEATSKVTDETKRKAMPLPLPRSKALWHQRCLSCWATPRPSQNSSSGRATRQSPQGREESPAPRQPEIDVAAIGAVFGESVARYPTSTEGGISDRGCLRAHRQIGDQKQEIVDTWDTRCPQVARSAEERRSYPRYVWHRKGPKVDPLPCGSTGQGSLIAKAVNKVLSVAEDLLGEAKSADPTAALAKVIAGWRKPKVALTLAERNEITSWAMALTQTTDSKHAATMLAELSLLFADVDATVSGRELRTRLALARCAKPSLLSANDEAAWVRGLS